MKFNLSISCNTPAELAHIVALLSGTAMVSAATVSGAPDVTFVPQPAPAAPAPVAAAPAFAPAQFGSPGPAVAAAAGDVDSTGLPWDERIHAETKAKNKDGSWRNRRGVDKTVIASVETQLRAALPPRVEQPAPAPFTPPPAAAAGAPFAPAPFAPTAEPAPTPEQLFGAPAPVAAAPAPQPAPVAPVAGEQRPFDPVADRPAFLTRAPEAAPAMAAPAPAPQPAPAPVAAAPAAPAQGAVPQLDFKQLMAAISQGLQEKKIDNAYLTGLLAHYQLSSMVLLANTHAHLMPNVIADLRARGVV